MNKRRQESNWMVFCQRQTEWIDGHGILVWASDYLSVLGAVGYIVGLLYNDLAAMFICYGILLIASLTHVFHAKYPLRLRHMTSRAKTSWMARGMLISIIFTVFGFAQVGSQIFLYANLSGVRILEIIQSFFVNLPFFNWLFRLCDVIFPPVNFILCCGIWLYEAMMINKLRSIPVFNNGAVPVTLFTVGALGGLGITSFFHTVRGESIDGILKIYWFALAALALCLISFFMSAKYSGKEGAQATSARWMRSGKMGAMVFVSTVLLGIIVPAAIVLAKTVLIDYLPFISYIPDVIFGIVLAGCGVACGGGFTFALFKCAVYNPVVKL